MTSLLRCRREAPAVLTRPEVGLELDMFRGSRPLAPGMCRRQSESRPWPYHAHQSQAVMRVPTAATASWRTRHRRS